MRDVDKEIDALQAGHIRYCVDMLRDAAKELYSDVENVPEALEQLAASAEEALKDLEAGLIGQVARRRTREAARRTPKKPDRAEQIIERVARAIYQESVGPAHWAAWDSFQPEAWGRVLAMAKARAAINALSKEEP